MLVRNRAVDSKPIMEIGRYPSVKIKSNETRDVSLIVLGKTSNWRSS